MATTSTQAPPTSDPSVVARLASKRDKWKGEAARLATEKAATEKERDDLKKQLEGLSGSGDRVKELEAQLRTMKHRGLFDRLAGESGAKQKALDTLFRESGYRADGDEPDEKAIRAALEKLRESHDFAFEAREEGGEGEERPASEKKKPAPDAGRGKPSDGKGTVYITREQLADPKWALDPANAEIKKTAKVRG
jgi:hypothetical protein